MSESVFGKVFRRELDNAPKDANPVDVVSNAMNVAKWEFAKTMPVWMRCNLIARDIVHISNEDEIDWNFVNEILTAKNDDIDFNLFEPVYNVDDFERIRAEAIAADIEDLGLPYHKRICKKCKTEFTLTKGEIRYFQKNGLCIPKKCYCCRKNIKKEEPVKQTKTEDAPVKTAMQLAMEKTGII